LRRIGYSIRLSAEDFFKTGALYPAIRLSAFK
jgi:hypothetical protein